MPRLVRARLAAMMFVLYFSIGAWVVTLPTYLLSTPARGGLHFTTAEVGWVSSAMAISGMAAQLCVGLLADRLFRADRVLAAACFGCGVLLAAAGWWCDRHAPRVAAAYRDAAAREVVAGRPVLEHVAAEAAGEPALPPPAAAAVRAALDRVKDAPAVRASAGEAFAVLFGIMLVQCFGSQLSVTLSTVIALRNVPNPSADFARVRVWGTVGWVASGNVIGLALVAMSAQPLYLAAGSAALTGVLALTLPPTRPKGVGRSLAETFGLPALRLLRDRAFVVFLLVAFGSAAMNQFYITYGHRELTDLGVWRPELVMTLAQVVEVGVMLSLPHLRPRQWVKPLMALGLLGWFLRAAAMMSESPALAVGLAVPMHGWSYAFFSVVAATFIDREAPPHLRASAQAVAAFLTAGVGPWVGNLLAAAVVNAHRSGAGIDWAAVWVVPVTGTAVLLAAFVALFKPRTAL